MSQDDKDLDPNTPVIVGIGIIGQREEDPGAAKEASRLMIDALQKAADDAGSQQLISDCDEIMVPQGMWAYTDPARLVARELGANKARTVYAKFGILQQTLMGEASRKIAEGEAEVVVVAGGEAKYRDLMATINGVEVSSTEQTEAPDQTLEPEAEMWLEAETNAGLGMPVGYYAIREIARRHAKGMDVESHRDSLGQLYSRFADIAVDNPHAWKRAPLTADTIRNASPKNKMLAFPYTKLLNTSWNVDQASALIFCSAAKARALGIPREKWVFPCANTESNYMLCVSQNRDLFRSVGAEVAAQRVLELAGLGIDELDFIDLYSCFPIAVQNYADALGVPEGKDYTFSGGMPFAGGPINNYVLQTTCRLVELLRENPGSHGLTSSVSGLLTKQGFGVFSTEPPPNGFVMEDVTETVAKLNPPVEVLDSFNGKAEIAGYTVLYQGEDPWRMVAICDTADGKRAVASSEDAALIEQAMTEELCGRQVSIAETTLTLA